MGERLLRTAVEKQGVRIERGVELVELAQDVPSPDPNPVTVVLRHADGRLEQAQAPWLISAEGAHSTVRASLVLPFEGPCNDRRVAPGEGGRRGEDVATDQGRRSGPEDGAGPHERPLRSRHEEAVEGGQGAGAVHQFRRRRGGHHRRRRPPPDAGKAGRVRPQTPGRAQGITTKK